MSGSARTVIQEGWMVEERRQMKRYMEETVDE